MRQAAASKPLAIRFLMYAAGIIILFVVVGIVGIVYTHVQRKHAIQQAKASFDMDLRRELQIGTGKLQVSMFLDKHSFAYKELGHEDFLQSDSWYLDAQHTIQGYSRYITPSDPICRIFAEFKFNDAERLIDYRDHLSCKEALL
jgi:hypothetical protein